MTSPFEFAKDDPETCPCEDCLVRKHCTRYVTQNEHGAIVMNWNMPTIGSIMSFRLLPAWMLEKKLP